MKNNIFMGNTFFLFLYSFHDETLIFIEHQTEFYDSTNFFKDIMQSKRLSKSHNLISHKEFNLIKGAINNIKLTGYIILTMGSIFAPQVKMYNTISTCNFLSTKIAYNQLISSRVPFATMGSLALLPLSQPQAPRVVPVANINTAWGNLNFAQNFRPDLFNKRPRITPLKRVSKVVTSNIKTTAITIGVTILIAKSLKYLKGPVQNFLGNFFAISLKELPKMTSADVLTLAFNKRSSVGPVLNGNSAIYQTRVRLGLGYYTINAQQQGCQWLFNFPDTSEIDRQLQTLAPIEQPEIGLKYELIAAAVPGTGNQLAYINAIIPVQMPHQQIEFRARMNLAIQPIDVSMDVYQIKTRWIISGNVLENISNAVLSHKEAEQFQTDLYTWFAQIEKRHGNTQFNPLTNKKLFKNIGLYFKNLGELSNRSLLLLYKLDPDRGQLAVSFPYNSHRKTVLDSTITDNNTLQSYINDRVNKPDFVQNFPISIHTNLYSVLVNGLKKELIRPGLLKDISDSYTKVGEKIITISNDRF